MGLIMEHLITVTLMIGLVVAGIIGYYCGKADKSTDTTRLKGDLVTERAVRHNLNCLIGDLKHDLGEMKYKRDALSKLLHEANVERLELQQEVTRIRSDLSYERSLSKGLLDDIKLLKAEGKQNKADAAAYNQCIGLWATDLPRLIKFNKEKELFFRIGYPEHKL